MSNIVCPLSKDKYARGILRVIRMDSTKYLTLLYSCYYASQVIVMGYNLV
jgi:hypothetical protein